MTIKKTNPDMTAEEFESWKRGDITTIGKYVIRPKRDFGEAGYIDSNGRHITAGWVVTNGLCNIVPGAGWAATKRGAERIIGALMVAETVTGGERYGPTKERSQNETKQFNDIFYGLMMLVRDW